MANHPKSILFIASSPKTAGFQAAYKFHLPMQQAVKMHLQSVPSKTDHGHHLWVSHLLSWWSSTVNSMKASTSLQESISKFARRVSSRQGVQAGGFIASGSKSHIIQ